MTDSAYNKIWDKFLRLFAPKTIPMPVNRKDRRTRQSIARRNKSLHIVSDSEQLPESDE